jgi:formylglycine-generating enzyme required for sulfatase activity
MSLNMQAWSRVRYGYGALIILSLLISSGCSPNEPTLVTPQTTAIGPQAELNTPSPQIIDTQEILPTPTPTAALPGPEGMVRINAGTYEVGLNQESEYYSTPMEVQLDEYWIDIYEVTNAQYQRYMDETGTPAPAVWPDNVNYPVRGVTWDQALAYCTWAHKRLLTEAEWEAAGRGSGKNSPVYPWRYDPDAGGQFNELPLDNPYAVGTYSFNVSPLGVYDLVGNVWEWVGDPYSEVPAGYKILRGGRFGLIRDLAYRYPATPSDERLVPYAGFRCAADEVER